jgi:hypothetical protein
VDSYDTVAVLLQLQNRTLFIAASYEPRDRKSTVERETALTRQLYGLSESIQTARSQIAGEQIDILLYTDFNRHYEL